MDIVLPNTGQSGTYGIPGMLGVVPFLGPFGPRLFGRGVPSVTTMLARKYAICPYPSTYVPKRRACLIGVAANFSRGLLSLEKLMYVPAVNSKPTFSETCIRI